MVRGLSEVEDGGPGGDLRERSSSARFLERPPARDTRHCRGESALGVVGGSRVFIGVF